MVAAAAGSPFVAEYGVFRVLDMTGEKRMLREVAIGISGLIVAGAAFAGELTLAHEGKAECVIIVPPGSMSWEGDDKELRYVWAPWSEEPERLRRLERDSIRDLAHYLGKMSGTVVEIAEALPTDDARVPIHVGSAAESVFGPVGISKAGKFGFRVVAVPGKGVGLYGESEYGTSYAIYELLHRLGCRWYIPSEMGECIPSVPVLTMPAMDESLAPATEWRAMQSRTADWDFRRRTRFGDTHFGGNVVIGGHFLEKYVSNEQRELHPEWCLHVDGKPHPTFLRWTREDVADAIADELIRRLDQEYQPSISLAPGDYVVPTEDPEERKHDPEPRVWEPAAGRWSVTDPRLVMLANRVATRVGKQYPDVLFNLNAYVNYSMPPAREKVHPNVIPSMSPIDFNRHHPMTWDGHPNEFWLRDMLEGWAKVSSRIKFRGYGFNLAEITAPNPFITKWGTDVPLLLNRYNAVFWAPETMGGWESMMPGFYLSMRISFDPNDKPDEILAELWSRFYGAAAEPMSQYWHLVDHAWIEAREYSGSGFGYLRMFTPEIMAEARRLIDSALAKCETITEYRRVKMIEESLALFELFMKMREDFADGRLGTLADDLEDWHGSVRHLRRRYKDQYAFDSGLAMRYVNNYFGHSYADATRMDKACNRLGAPLLNWKYKHNPGPEEESIPWTTSGFDDKDWPTTHVVRDTWSRIGHHNTITDTASGSSGRMVYRAETRLRPVPEGKRAFLWIGSTDGTAKLFLNGKHVRYVAPEDTKQHKKGDVSDAFPGPFCRPGTFDVTDFLVPGVNRIAILAERNRLWELGTGGLMGPVVIYVEK
jgi:hypothetical protein